MRKLLIVIDMQNDFIDGSLGTKEAVSIVDKVAAKIKEYPAEDIFATRDTHPENYLETQEGRKLPVLHCVYGTKGWEINEKVAAALNGAEVIDKPTFGSVDLADKISQIATDQFVEKLKTLPLNEMPTEEMKEIVHGTELEITLIGLCTDICVVSNALLLKATLPEATIKVVADCCAGVTVESHEAALTTMRMCQIEVE